MAKAKVTEMPSGNVSDGDMEDEWETDDLTGELTCEWRENQYIAKASVFQIGSGSWCCSVDAGDVSMTFGSPCESADKAKETAKEIALTWLRGCVETRWACKPC